jgi:hypothetical protein
MNLFTYRDAVRHVVDYLGADPEAQAKRDARRAVRAAYREFTAAHRWTYYYQRGRVNVAAPQVTGTVTYVFSTRQLTLSGATWPSWVIYGTVVINNVSYDVDTSVSSTVITLSTNSCPQADISTPTGYTVYRDTYPLPADFLACDAIIDVGNFLRPTYVNPQQWLEYQRLSKSPARPRWWTITGDPHFQGAMALRFYPPPDSAYQYDFIYQRRPRNIVYDEQLAGNVSLTGGLATISGTGTAFDSRWAGSVIRTRQDSSTPEGLEWETPYDQQRVIVSVQSATALTVDSAYPTTFNNVGYVISDIIDVEEGAMLNCFLRCCEKQVAFTRKNKAAMRDASDAYTTALLEAREADARHFEEKVAGQYGPYANRLAFMPRGPDIA